jgi:hypothetical protein
MCDFTNLVGVNGSSQERIEIIAIQIVRHAVPALFLNLVFVYIEMFGFWNCLELCRYNDLLVCCRNSNCRLNV